MKQCVIWGAGNCYESIINQVKFEELKGNLECRAILSKSTVQFAKKRDGYDVIGKRELINIGFDYLIIAVEKDFEEVLTEVLAMGIPRKKVINGKVFKLPNFDFVRYISLRDNPVTILSDDCWGGRVYNELDLQFTSPLINIGCFGDSYRKLMQNPTFYFSQPIYMEREGSVRKNLCPIGRIGEGDKGIQIYFVHDKDWETAERHWNSRKQRVTDRIFVKFGLEEMVYFRRDLSDSERKKNLAVFSQLPYPKICFYSGETKEKDVVYCKRFEKGWKQGDILQYENQFFEMWIRQVPNLMKTIDLLKLLNGEPDYIREQ